VPHWKITRTGTQVPKLVVQYSSVGKNSGAQFIVGVVLYDGTSNSEPTPQIGVLSGPDAKPQPAQHHASRFGVEATKSAQGLFLARSLYELKLQISAARGSERWGRVDEGPVWSHSQDSW
jgi:hypothetical protein